MDPPRLSVLPRLEITAGVGFVDHGDGRHTEYVLQSKYLFRELAPNGIGVGLAAGIGFDPQSQVGGGVEGDFAYVPLSVSLRDDRVVLHGNLGWHFQRGEHEHNGHVHDESQNVRTRCCRSRASASP